MELSLSKTFAKMQMSKEVINVKRINILSPFKLSEEITNILKNDIL